MIIFIQIIHSYLKQHHSEQQPTVSFTGGEPHSLPGHHTYKYTTTIVKSQKNVNYFVFVIRSSSGASPSSVRPDDQNQQIFRHTQVQLLYSRSSYCVPDILSSSTRHGRSASAPEDERTSSAVRHPLQSSKK